MQQRPRLLALRARHPSPVGAARLARCSPAGPSRHAVQDRPIQGLVDDLVFGGHGRQPLVFSPQNLSRSAQGRYVETSEIVL